MTEVETTISLAHLKDEAGKARNNYRLTVTTSDLHALIHAVEAGRDYFGQSIPYADDRVASDASNRFRDALRRFTFEGYA